MEEITPTPLPNNIPDGNYNKINTLPTPANVNESVQFEGTVLRSSNTKLLEFRRVYRCAKCKREFEVEAQVETSYQFETPPSCGGTTPTGDLCRNKKFTVIEGKQQTTDYQELRVQEPTHNIVSAGLQRQVTVILLGELVGDTQAGDFVTIKGRVRVRWLTSNEDEQPQLEIVVVADYITSRNIDRLAVTITEEMETKFKNIWEQHADHPLLARDLILQSVSPELCGMRLCKLAVMLVALGGVPHLDEVTKTTIRGTVHLLLVGDPGTGKSQLLNFASKLGPRHVQTTGGGTTSAGLTVAVVNVGGELSLDAGALVLADGGVCCIDEFSTMSKADKADIHEAMEQQTLSVAKAGIVSQLHTRTAILAATNPKGKYDCSKSLSLNTAIDPPLLSRFDIILIMLDERNQQWDERVSDYVLNGHKPDIAPLLTTPELQSYIVYTKIHFFPEITEEAKLVIQEYYNNQRGKERRESGRTSVRLLESLIRISQAHAKLMMHKSVLLMDAVCAVLLIESSQNGASNSKENSEFPTDPDESYKVYELRLLQTLKLEYLIDGSIELSQIGKENSQCEKLQSTTQFTSEAEKSIEEEELETRESFWKNYLESQRRSEMSEIVFPSQKMRGGQLRKGQSLLFNQEKRKSNETIEERSQSQLFKPPQKVQSILQIEEHNKTNAVKETIKMSSGKLTVEKKAVESPKKLVQSKIDFSKAAKQVQKMHNEASSSKQMEIENPNKDMNDIDMDGLLDGFELLDDTQSEKSERKVDALPQETVEKPNQNTTKIQLETKFKKSKETEKEAQKEVQKSKEKKPTQSLHKSTENAKKISQHIIQKVTQHKAEKENREIEIDSILEELDDSSIPTSLSKIGSFAKKPPPTTIVKPPQTSQTTTQTTPNTLSLLQKISSFKTLNKGAGVVKVSPPKRKPDDDFDLDDIDEMFKEKRPL
ncbi:DNA replication licensing factor MCM9, putative [Entamoeba invadens IP1]|uniref:DNA helicase n=1 Tax=Entamoeba invadens IP1 TaxID=370355 RepID=A0A0A1U0T3_ENTIV|nr:DNA replication licensing factor MCM9, putative [Entamoeba invadens IP1]ELP87487.1 DNA replication licensing factor MCM9, putative [Entamoeba invadens IP1]|eukprot:XP_004254258.1 DNA replication licensing factor MCM9, putative [Entamoeba invadens IP1]